MPEDPPVVNAPPVFAAPATAGDVEQKPRRFPCKGCGAGLEFKPGGDSIRCPYCGFVEKIPRTADEIDEFSFNDYLAKPKKGLGIDGRDVRCGQCAAIVHLEKTTKATRCPFCGTAIVDELGDAGDADVRPEALAPFKIEPNEAQRLFLVWLKGLWFAPSILRQEIRDSRVRGTYCPHWTFDSHTSSAYQGERGDAYYVTMMVPVTVSGKTTLQSQQVRHMRWSFASGNYETFFDDVLVPAGSAPRLGLAYRSKALVPYDPSYLSGFDAERPSVPVEAGWSVAKAWMDNAIYQACCARIGGDEQRGVRVKTAFRGITFKMVLLPVYVSTYRFQNKAYRFQVDGQTGKVIGDRPYSVLKILALVLVIAIILGLAALVAALVSNH